MRGRVAEIIYDKDGITLWFGNCVDVLPDLDRVDHVITDPPFEGQAHAFGKHRNDAGDLNLKAGADAGLAFSPMTREIRTLCGRQFARLTRRWCLVFCQVEAVSTWIASLEVESQARTLHYMRTAIWVKPDAMPQITGDRPGMGYESIVCCHADGKSTWNGGGKVGVFTFNAKEPAEQKIHQTQKPQALMRHLVAQFTSPGELVLDPFAGSGSTAVACKVLGRRCVTIEKNPEFAELARRRLERMDQQPDLFGAAPTGELFK